MKNRIKLELISEGTRVIGTYDERIKEYRCPCGKGKVISSKERPNSSGSGYQATFCDVFCYCTDCDAKYDFSSDGHATLK